MAEYSKSPWTGDILPGDVLSFGVDIPIPKKGPFESIGIPPTPRPTWSQLLESGNRTLVDLAGEPLTIETLELGKRVIEGQPDFDELRAAAFRMQREMRVLPRQIRLHPRDWGRLLNTDQPVTGVRAMVFDPGTFEANLGSANILVSQDPSIPVGGWRLESDIDGVGMDALAGPIRKVSLKCLTCSRPMEAWVAVDWHHNKTVERSEEVEFLERLRMKVKEKYLAQREVLVEFVEWVKSHDNRIVNTSLVAEFLESKVKP